MRSLRVRWIAVVSASVLAPLIAPTEVGADPIEDQRDRVAQITDQLEDLERQVDILTEDYAVATDELRQVEEDVAAAEKAVTEQQAEVAELQDELSDVAIQAFMEAGGSSGTAIFTNASALNANLQRRRHRRRLPQHGAHDVHGSWARAGLHARLPRSRVAAGIAVPTEEQRHDNPEVPADRRRWWILGVSQPRPRHQ